MKCNKCSSEVVKITWSPAGVRTINCNGCGANYQIPPELHACNRCSKVDEVVEMLLEEKRKGEREIKACNEFVDKILEKLKS